MTHASYSSNSRPVRPFNLFYSFFNVHLCGCCIPCNKLDRCTLPLPLLLFLHIACEYQLSNQFARECHSLHLTLYVTFTYVLSPSCSRQTDDCRRRRRDLTHSSDTLSHICSVTWFTCDATSLSRWALSLSLVTRHSPSSLSFFFFSLFVEGVPLWKVIHRINNE